MHRSPDITTSLCVLGSNIVNLSLGASRVMILKSKSDYIPEGHTTPLEGKIYQKVTLPHNSLFVLGWKSNRDFLHSIRTDKRLAILKEDHELLHQEQRISLTFRSIATFIRPQSVPALGGGGGGRALVVGQGARRKVRIEATGHPDGCMETMDRDLAAHTTTEEVEREVDVLEQSKQMLYAFSAENRTACFDWEEHYGQGFDIVNFCFMNGKS